MWGTLRQPSKRYIKNKKFEDIFEDLDSLNKWKETYVPTCPDFNYAEYGALMGRYAESHIRYENEIQFMYAFFTVATENIPRLRAKLRANEMIRNLDEAEVMQGKGFKETTSERLNTNRNIGETSERKDIGNQATNPDTAPSTDAFDPLPYINNQTATKHNRETDTEDKYNSDRTFERNSQETLAKANSIYVWKHQLGSQAYGEFLDGFRDLFIKVLSNIDKPDWKEAILTSYQKEIDFTTEYNVVTIDDGKDYGYRSTITKNGCEEKWYIVDKNTGWGTNRERRSAEEPDYNVTPVISTYDNKKYLRTFGRFGIIIVDKDIVLNSVEITFATEFMCERVYNNITKVDKRNKWITNIEYVNERTLKIEGDFSKNYNIWSDNITGIKREQIEEKIINMSILIEKVKLNLEE